ncbi:hypothetical protein [Streptomyces sp. NPDC101776]|uniref:hypothetical protein n=1 Tax=Streptomyces sp. NPDC101776 TaxID=3366146 RepID=UPI003802D35A
MRPPEEQPERVVEAFVSLAGVGFLRRRDRDREEVRGQRFQSVDDSVPHCGTAVSGPRSVVRLGATTRFHALPIEQLRARSEEMAAMFDWFNTVGFRADTAALREHSLELTTLATWVRGHWSAPAEPTIAS